MSITKNKLQILLVLIYIGFVGWWASFQHVLQGQGMSIQWFGGTYGVTALIGSIIGFVTASRWGGFKTVLGKALMFFSIGLLAQEAGQLITTYYIYGMHIDIPYPSWGDLAYFSSTLSYLLGGFYLCKSVGAGIALKSGKFKAIAVLVPVLMLAISYGFFLNHHQYDFYKPLTVFLDAGYPLGDALYVSMALLAFLLSRKLLGGVMRKGLLVLMLALAVQYAADFTFLYKSSRGTWIAGSYDDIFYLSAYFTTAIALSIFYKVYSNLKAETGGK